MTRQLFNFLATLLFAILFSLVLPWWSVMIAALLTALLIPLRKSAVFFVPFFAILIYWAGYAYILSSGNDFIMAKKIAVLLPLGGNPYLLMVLSGIIGGLAAGISGILGKQLQLIIKKIDY